MNFNDLELIQKYAEKLNKTIGTLAVDSVKFNFLHTYYIWQAYKDVFGVKNAKERYSDFWAERAKFSFAAAMKQLKLDKIHNVADLGKIIEHIISGGPSVYLVKRNKSDEHTGHVLWCANPGYNKIPGTTFCCHDYYRAEGYIANKYISTFVEEAKKNGLNIDITVQILTPRCVDCMSSACQIILKRKDVNNFEELPKAEYAYFEEEIGTEEPLLYILKKQGRTISEYAPGAFFGAFVTDYCGWLQLYKGSRCSNELIINYKKFWSSYSKLFVKEAKLDLEIGKIETIIEAAKIIHFSLTKRFTPCKIKIISDKCCEITIEDNPFILTANRIKASKDYYVSIRKAEEYFLQCLLNELKLKKQFQITMISAKNGTTTYETESDQF